MKPLPCPTQTLSSLGAYLTPPYEIQEADLQVTSEQLKRSVHCMCFYFFQALQEALKGRRGIEEGEVGDTASEGSINSTASVHKGKDGAGRQMGEGIPES